MITPHSYDCNNTPFKLQGEDESCYKIFCLKDGFYEDVYRFYDHLFYYGRKIYRAEPGGFDIP